MCIIVQIADAVILQANNTDKIMLAAAVLMQQPVLCHQTLLPSCNWALHRLKKNTGFDNHCAFYIMHAVRTIMQKIK